MKELFRDNYGKSIIEHSSYIEANGGDGTLLRAINLFKDKGKKFFGVAGGTKNFLMNPEKRIQENAKVKKFKLIKVKVEFYNNTETIIAEAFNDVMLGGNMNSWINFDVDDKDNILGNFNGGGLIISTPQGSTGISKNNGGVILPLSSHNWVVTGDKTDRPIRYVLEPRKMIIRCSSREPVTLWVDGSNHIFNDVAKITITVGSTVDVVFNDYERFKEKRK